MTRKITDGLARIRSGEISTFRLGNIEARRDWGHAKDYVRAMHAIVQCEDPMDFVIGTGESHTVKQFLEIAAGFADLDWREVVEIDPDLYRPSDVPHLEADASLARDMLNWEPQVGFKELVEDMVASDLRAKGVRM